MPPEKYHCRNRVIKMKFIAILFFLCAIVAATSTSSTTTTTETSTTSTTASSVPAPVPCGNGPQGPCAKKLYFFY
ncbi:uncharacterized protein Dyak_GE24294 [Drosophila yakuba]|uniref:Drosophila melanogaster n=2 Tax=Drosophila yakuba TaxID=7245 RepID=B4PS54_DROYA|nr:uncharacterized protein Dyak_GE24294 [Drosophila yakuba]